MRFITFREPRQTMENLREIAQYLKSEMVTNLRELRTGLDLLTFDENFESFVVSVTIPGSATDFPIRNELIRFTPSEWVVVDVANGSVADLTRGLTQWNDNYAYFANNSSTAFEGKIRFFR